MKNSTILLLGLLFLSTTVSPPPLLHLLTTFLGFPITLVYQTEIYEVLPAKVIKGLTRFHLEKDPDPQQRHQRNHTRQLLAAGRRERLREHGVCREPGVHRQDEPKKGAMPSLLGQHANGRRPSQCCQSTLRRIGCQ